MPRVLTQTDVADFRERLCEAATRLFDTRGREGFTMRELASELGVSAMTPYRYFKDKEDILAAVRARAFTRWSEQLEAAFAGAASAPEKSRAVFEAYTAFAFNDSAAYKLMFDLSQPDEAEYPELVAANTRAKRTMTAYVHELVDSGVIEGDPELIGRVFWSALHGAVVLKLAGKLGPDGYDFERVAGESFRVLFEGYRKK